MRRHLVKKTSVSVLADELKIHPPRSTDGSSSYLTRRKPLSSGRPDRATLAGSPTRPTSKSSWPRPARKSPTRTIRRQAGVFRFWERRERLPAVGAATVLSVGPVAAFLDAVLADEVAMRFPMTTNLAFVEPALHERLSPAAVVPRRLQIDTVRESVVIAVDTDPGIGIAQGAQGKSGPVELFARD